MKVLVNYELNKPTYASKYLKRKGCSIIPGHFPF